MEESLKFGIPIFRKKIPGIFTKILCGFKEIFGKFWRNLLKILEKILNCEEFSIGYFDRILNQF